MYRVRIEEEKGWLGLKCRLVLGVFKQRTGEEMWGGERVLE